MSSEENATPADFPGEEGSLPAEHPVRVFRRVFSNLEPGKVMPLEELYAPDVVFEDPLHRVVGREAVRKLFDRMNAALRFGRFEHGEALVGVDTAMLTWTMRLQLRGLKHEVLVPGATFLRFGEHGVTSQRDYFDAGALVYEHVPLVGTAVRAIKAKL